MVGVVILLSLVFLFPCTTTGAAPGEKSFAVLHGRKQMDAEDFRFHAIRGRAYDTFSRTHSGNTVLGFTHHGMWVRHHGMWVRLISSRGQ